MTITKSYEGPRDTPSDTVKKYTVTAVTLHWVIALLIVCNVVLGVGSDYVPDSAVRDVVDLHKSLGITALGLVLGRIVWRYWHRPPPMPGDYRRVEVLAAHTAHYTLYALILAIPLTGWIHDSAWKAAAEHPMYLFWGIPWFRLPFVAALDPVTKETVHTVFGEAHTFLGFVLYAVLALHVAGALKHQFLDKKRELQRMWL